MHGIVFTAFLVLSAYCNTLWAHMGPTLVDIKVSGSSEAPLLEISPAELQQGEPYLLVIVNNNPYPLSLQFEKFGQAVFTQNLQGSPGVSQEALTLLPNSKVIWQFVTSEAGEFLFSLTNQSNQTGNKVKLAIKSALVVPEPAPAPPVTVEAKQEPVEVKPVEPKELKPKRSGSIRFLGESQQRHLA